MQFLWKGAAALSLAVAAMAAAPAPAQAQIHSGYGARDAYRGDYRTIADRRWDGRRDWRGNDRRHWRGDRRNWRGHHRQRCWTEWRYNHYRDRRVKVRVCN